MAHKLDLFTLNYSSTSWFVHIKNEIIGQYNKLRAIYVAVNKKNYSYFGWYVPAHADHIHDKETEEKNRNNNVYFRFE